MSVAALTLPAFLALAAQCTPTTADGRLIVAPETLASVVWTESRLGALRVGINEPGARAPVFGSLAAAAAWVTVNAHRSLDVGIAQINTSAGHMQRRGLPVVAALDPCVGIRVGSEVLAGCYRTAPAVEEQRRIRLAAACYNTGKHNEAAPYVQRVQASAEVVVPAIRLRGEAAASSVSAAPPAQPPAPIAPPSLCAPAWDPWALARCSTARTPASPAGPKHGPTAPVALEAVPAPRTGLASLEEPAP